MRTYPGNKLPNLPFNILMMNCFIKCITFSAPHIVKPQWRIMDASFISFCFQAAGWKHTSIGRLKMNTRSSWKQQLQNVVLLGLHLRLWFCCSHHPFPSNLCINNKTSMAAYELSNLGDFTFYADADSILLMITCFCYSMLTVTKNKSVLSGNFISLIWIIVMGHRCGRISQCRKWHSVPRKQ